jgi:hypothetical protein
VVSGGLPTATPLLLAWFCSSTLIEDFNPAAQQACSQIRAAFRSCLSHDPFGRPRSFFRTTLLSGSMPAGAISVGVSPANVSLLDWHGPLSPSDEDSNLVEQQARSRLCAFFPGWPDKSAGLGYDALLCVKSTTSKPISKFAVTLGRPVRLMTMAWCNYYCNSAILDIIRFLDEFALKT